MHGVCVAKRMCLRRSNAGCAQIFLGMRFLIQAEDDTEEVLDAVRSGGGQLVESADEATHIIADTMSDVCSQRPSPPRRTRAWVLECVRQRTTVWPTKSLEWKGWRFLPRPGHAIPTVEGGDGVQFVITLTGYTGIQRDVLKMLIRLTGAECTDALTKKNTHLLCNNPTSKKAVAAESWRIQVVNHLGVDQVTNLPAVLQLLLSKDHLLSFRALA